MSIDFCVERPSKEGAPLGWGIELCGSSSCLGGLRCLLNTEGIPTLPMFLLKLSLLGVSTQKTINTSHLLIIHLQ